MAQSTAAPSRMKWNAIVTREGRWPEKTLPEKTLPEKTLPEKMLPENPC
jgi:hypothetical protein